jgi:hypothetical protein
MTRREEDMRAALAALTGEGGDATARVRAAAHGAAHARMQALAAELAEARRLQDEGDGDAHGTRPVEVIADEIRRLRARLGEDRHQPSDSPSLRDSDAPE